MSAELYQAKTNYFTAGFEINSEGIIINAAPIIKWSIGKHIDELKKFVEIKKGSIELIKW